MFSPEFTKSFDLIQNHILDLSSAANLLLNGGVLVFPTETFFALGCLASNSNAVKMIYRIKKRSHIKPLPLLCGSLFQIKSFFDLSSVPQNLLEKFWPGPLSILLPAKAALSAPLLNIDGKAAVRLTAHTLAAQLSLLTDAALTASSANFTGHHPAACFADLNVQLLYEVCTAGGGVILPGDSAEEPAGGLPSTLIDFNSTTPSILMILREGVISERNLEELGFLIQK